MVDRMVCIGLPMLVLLAISMAVGTGSGLALGLAVGLLVLTFVAAVRRHR